MSQSHHLISALKVQLKVHSKTYADVAKHLGLSQASVKRLFSDGNLSISRLELICDFINLPFTELVLSMNIESYKITSLSLLQEQEIADDIMLLLVAVCVINGYTFSELLQQYQINEYECIQKLAKLDQLKVIELLPNNRIKLKIASNFSWLPDGPIQRFFLNRIKEEFFDSRFKKSTEKLIVINGLISLHNNAQLQSKMQKLCNEFVDSKSQDAPLNMDEKHGTTMVLALRQWGSKLFDDIRK
ncbi:MAG: helix-turn-helix transcriptional regulator [Alteromonadales bacterium]|nr:helix-turn-helix transcriptional regulator [Alteromonadales bacterium]